MNFLKKQAAGFYITVLTVVLAVASVVSYLINCGTDYFSKMENHFGLVVCLLIAVVLDIIYIAGVNKRDLKNILMLFRLYAEYFLWQHLHSFWWHAYRASLQSCHLKKMHRP